MTLDDFLNHIEAGGALNTPEIYRLMDEMSDEARRVTCEINNSYHSQEELRAFMSRLTGKPVDETFKMFPPFYTDFGKNITIGRRVFINAGCHFQDHGGVTLGDGCLSGIMWSLPRSITVRLPKTAGDVSGAYPVRQKCMGRFQLHHPAGCDRG